MARYQHQPFGLAVVLAAATAFSMTPMERYTYDAGTNLLPGAAEIK